jgi:hypothetical protein
MAILRTLLGGLTKGLGGGPGISEEQTQRLEDYLASKGIQAPGQRPEVGGLGNALRNELGYSREQLEPQGFAERIGQGVIGSVPSLLLGGKKGSRTQGAIKAAPRIAAGQVASAGLGELGAPESIQKLGQLAGESASTLRSLKKSNPSKVPSLKEHTSQTYEKARESLAKNEKGSARAIKPFLDKANKLWKTETNTDTRKVVEDIANTISQNVDASGNIDIDNAWANKQALNQQYKSAKSSERRYIEEARTGLEKVLKEHSALNPKFDKLRETADSLNRLKSTNNIIGEYIDSAGWLGKKLKLVGIPKVLDKLETVGRTALSPQGRAYYRKLGNAIIDDRKDDAKRYAIALNNVWEKEQDKLEENGFEDIPLEEGFEEV